MTDTYFLGANTKRGFSSLYGEFARGAYVHRIKGCPGSGKSTLMKRLGTEAEARGYDVEYVLCSGDPQSLDGVYVPQLQTAWLDATAPHVSEPSVFGADGDYIDLGRFCRLPLRDADAQRVRELNAAYKREYGRAYALLASAGALRDAVPRLYDGETLRRIDRRMCSVAQRRAGRRTDGGEPRRRYLSAITCEGVIELYSKLCKPIYILDDTLGLGSYALERLVTAASGRSAALTVCPSALDPDVTEAVVLPDAVYLSGSVGVTEGRHVRLDTLIDPETRRRERPALRELARERTRLLSMAQARLAAAKALHDELEAVYRPYMDFSEMSSLTIDIFRRACYTE